MARTKLSQLCADFALIGSPAELGQLWQIIASGGAENRLEVAGSAQKLPI